MRSGQLGLIDPARKASLFKQLSARGWRSNEPVKVHLEAPAFFAKLIEDQFGEGASSYRQAPQAEAVLGPQRKAKTPPVGSPRRRAQPNRRVLTISPLESRYSTSKMDHGCFFDSFRCARNLASV